MNILRTVTHTVLVLLLLISYYRIKNLLKCLFYLARCSGICFSEWINRFVSHLKYEAYQGLDDDAVIRSEL